jgi:hypothetical protein
MLLVGRSECVDLWDHRVVVPELKADPSELNQMDALSVGPLRRFMRHGPGVKTVGPIGGVRTVPRA